MGGCVIITERLSDGRKSSGRAENLENDTERKRKNDS